MLYYENLEEIIFNKHHHLDSADELIVISGYLGPAPLLRIKELPIQTTIIGGMYSQGINQSLFASFNKIKNQTPNLHLLFSTIEIHSKIYMWRKKERVIAALIGSANFTRNGLGVDFRESLADASNDTFAPLNKYLDLIMSNSTESPNINKKAYINEKPYQTLDYQFQETKDKYLKLDSKYHCDIPLFGLQNNVPYVYEKSGLNWGLSDGNVALGDAYIRIPKDLLKSNIELIPPFDDTYTHTSKRIRNSDPIEIIWDDGFVMEASLEGVQILNGIRYPKQIASYSRNLVSMSGERISAKSILGRYLRKRLNVGLNDKITYETLQKYGRTTITLSLIEEGVYFADFSAL